MNLKLFSKRKIINYEFFKTNQLLEISNIRMKTIAYSATQILRHFKYLHFENMKMNLSTMLKYAISIR